MINLTKLFASLVLAFGLITASNAASINPAVDGLTSDAYKVYQSETEEEKKKKEGEEEEPDC